MNKREECFVIANALEQIEIAMDAVRDNPINEIYDWFEYPNGHLKYAFDMLFDLAWKIDEDFLDYCYDENGKAIALPELESLRSL